MAMSKRSGRSSFPSVARFNIYLPSESLRRQIKTAAVQQDLSISEYCVQALKAQLDRDHGSSVVPTISSNGKSQASSPVTQARRFQRRVFGTRTLRVSSATLIRRAREHRA